MTDILLLFFDLANEVLAAVIVILATSLLLYNITRSFRDRVARTSGVVLISVIITYVGDVFLSLEPSLRTHEAVARLQYIGITLIPAALFHLSDALLDTTGLPSRGRRRRVIRLMYALSIVFLSFVLFTNAMITPVVVGRRVSFDPQLLFFVFVAFFLIAIIASFVNVDRARRRCLTRGTRSRMAYIELAIITPALAIFPYSVIFKGFEQSPILELTLVNTANALTIVMLLFLSYPLSFFGSRVPDRVVKTELLRFILRGPATAGLVLGVIVFTPPSGQILGLPGDDFMPFLAVTIVLLWQWVVDVSLPWLERRLIYNEDEEQFNKIQELTRQLLTRDDLLQLFDAILEAGCEYMRVSRAFVLSDTNGEGKAEIVRAIGVSDADLDVDGAIQAARSNGNAPILWNEYVLLTLYSMRVGSENRTLIGVLGVQAHAENQPLTEGDIEKLQLFRRRAARTLDDLNLQSEIYAALEGLLPQFVTSRENVADVEFRPGYTETPVSLMPERDQIIEQVAAALRHYWGGPGLAQSRLLELEVVRQALPDNDNNPVKALRAVLDRAIEIQKPEGERDYRSQEWMLYNILHLRFIKKRLVRDTARMLFISDANLYRKQNLAIEAAADTIMRLEQEAQAAVSGGARPPATRGERADLTPRTADQPPDSPPPAAQ